MTAHDPLSTAFLLIETTKVSGEPVWAVKWRSTDGGGCAAGSAHTPAGNRRMP